MKWQFRGVLSADIVRNLLSIVNTLNFTFTNLYIYYLLFMIYGTLFIKLNFTTADNILREMGGWGSLKGAYGGAVIILKIGVAIPRGICIMNVATWCSSLTKGAQRMKILLLKCGICNSWYRPQAHNGHCGYCGALPLKLTSNKITYWNLTGARMVQVVSGIPNHLRASILNTMITQ